MKALLICFLLASCSSTPEKSVEAPIPEEGVLDKALQNKDCGLLDQFYDGCKNQEPEAE